MLESYLQVFSTMLTFEIVIWVFFSVLIGILIGAMPGLTATMTVSVLLSLTYGMPSLLALAVLISIYKGAIYGGSRSAILLNVPGTPSSAASTLDGFPLAKMGQADKASYAATINSGVGGIVGVLIFIAGAPLVAQGALHICVWEYFWLAIFGIAISANLTSGSVGKGLIAGFLGLLVTTVGLDEIHGGVRLTFDQQELMGGIELVPAMIGLFGFAEAIDTIAGKGKLQALFSEKKETGLQLFIGSMRFLKKYWNVTLTSGVMGTLIGAIPGVGADIASWVSYYTAKRRSKTPEEFGKGAYEGLLASETANNAATTGAFIPLLTLGIPGCAATAIILGGMRLHGLRPGPLFYMDQGEYIAYFVVIFLLSNIFLMLAGMGVTPILSKIVRVPPGTVMPIVIVFCVIGAFALHYRTFDILVMLIFGIIGFVMRRFQIPAAPMVLGIVLGGMAEDNMRRGLLSDPSIVPFLTRPISLVIIVIMIAIIAGPWVMQLIRSYQNKKHTSSA